MATCESLQHILDKSLPGSPTLFESLSSWSPKKPINPIDNAFTELFGELHFQENHHGESNTPPSSSPHYPASPPSSKSPSSSTFSDSNALQFIGIEELFRDNNERTNTPISPKCYYPSNNRHGGGFSSMSSEGLSHCTEGLGSESSDEVEEFGNDNISLDWRRRREEKQGANVVQERSEYMYCDHRRSRVNRRSFPPPISCIGSNGKPFVNFKTYREKGRFILKEVRIPQQEFLRAIRENGRLKLELIHSDDEIFEEDEEEKIDDEGDFDLKGIKEVDEDRKEQDSLNKKEEVIQESNVDYDEQDSNNNDNKEN